jgi:hypothetical protein
MGAGGVRLTTAPEGGLGVIVIPGGTEVPVIDQLNGCTPPVAVHVAV